MTDASQTTNPSYAENFPALGRLNRNNNINNQNNNNYNIQLITNTNPESGASSNNSNSNINNNSNQQQQQQQFDSNSIAVGATVSTGTTTNNNNNLATTTTTNSWSSQAIRQQNKLNQIIIANSQHQQHHHNSQPSQQDQQNIDYNKDPHQQQQQQQAPRRTLVQQSQQQQLTIGQPQQVPDSLIDPIEQNSDAMVQQYHLKQQQQQQQQKQPHQQTLVSSNNTILFDNHNRQTDASRTSAASSNINNNNNNNNISSSTNLSSVVSANTTTTNNSNNISTSSYNNTQNANQVINNNNNTSSYNNNAMQNHTQQSAAGPTPAAAHHHTKRPGMPNPIISDRCCTFKISAEERRHRDIEQSKILKEIMQKTSTKIEVTPTKDGALNFCIIGKEAALPIAKNLVLNDFQTSVTLTVSVPKTFHGRLLGPKGQRLSSIQDETLTKITIPRKEEDSDIIKIVGLKSNAEQAARSIEKYAREFAEKVGEKVTVERIYLLFITGPFNENLKRWEEMGAKVSTSGGILPSNAERESGHADEVTFTIVGEATAVNQVKDEIQHIYEDKKKKCTFVNIEVKKAQHKYILGVGGHNLRTLFAKTGVSVELPQESESETITLRGERSKIGPALSELYTQAHSETDDYFQVESWLHKYLIGARKTNSLDFKSMGVEVKSLDDKIKLHGPPTEVENIKDIFEAELDKLRRTIIRKDIRVEPRIHGYVIGRSGATVDQIREESGAFVLVPKNDESSEFITLEGNAEAVAIAEEKINAIAKKYESSKKLVIDQQLHGSIIGRGGEKIRSIREKFSQVVFTFPEQGSKNNEIIILGPADEVEECYKYLEEFHQQLQENNHQAQVPIKKNVVKYVQDAQAAIKRIKVDHRVKVDLFINDNSANNNNKNGDEKGKGNAGSETNAPQSVTSGNNAKPTGDGSSENDADKKAKQTGGNKGAKKNKVQQQVQTNGVPAKTAAASGNQQTGGEESYAVVVGKKEDVDAAKVKLIKLFDELATTTEIEINCAYKLRSLLGPKTRLYRQLLEEFQQKVVISFPSGNNGNNGNKQQVVSGKDASNGNVKGRDNNDANGEVSSNKGPGSKKNKQQQQSGTASEDDSGVASNNNSTNSNGVARVDVVKIRGPKNVAKKAEKRFEALMAECQDKLDKNYVAQVVVESAVFDKFQYADKIKLNKIRDSNGVKLTIPDNKRETVSQLHCSVTGYEKNVQVALQQFNELCKEVEERIEETIEIASQVHPRLIGAQGRAVKKLMDDFKIGVKFARQGDPNPNAVTLSGRTDNVQAAKKHMKKLADQYLASISANTGSTNSSANNTGGLVPSPSVR